MLDSTDFWRKWQPYVGFRPNDSILEMYTRLFTFFFLTLEQNCATLHWKNTHSSHYIQKLQDTKEWDVCLCLLCWLWVAVWSRWLVCFPNHLWVLFCLDVTAQSVSDWAVTRTSTGRNVIWKGRKRPHKGRRKRVGGRVEADIPSRCETVPGPKFQLGTQTNATWAKGDAGLRCTKTRTSSRSDSRQASPSQRAPRVWASRHECVWTCRLLRLFRKIHCLTTQQLVWKWALSGCQCLI